MTQPNAIVEAQTRRKRLAWAGVLVAATLVGGVTVQWFTSVPDETADRMELVSSTWSNDATPALTVVTRLRRSDGRRPYPRGSVWTKGPLTRARLVSYAPDLGDRSSMITARFRFVRAPRQPVVLECTALQPRASRGMLLLASWEQGLFHRPSSWLPLEDRVRLPDITLPVPELANTEKHSRSTM